MKPIINVTRSSMPEYEEYIEEIKDLWSSHWLTNMGEKHEKLQSLLEKYLDVKHVTLYTNGHLALEGCWELLNFPQGKEVITTPFTFVSTTNAIARNGLVPVFCDIKEDDYTIDENKIEALITEKTVAICPVHVYGNVCNIEAIESIANKYNLKVVYDAAHAFGVKYKGKSIASFGDLSMFSFHATKVFNTIEGGAICFKNDEYVETLDDLKNFGIRDVESIVYRGGNAKMNEFQAAMGICNLKHLDEELAKRKKIVDLYRLRLSGVKGIKLVTPKDDVEENYAYMPVVFDNYKYSRDEIYELLKKENIISRKYFYPISNEIECYEEYKDKYPTPIAKYLSERVLTLPLYASLDEEIVNKICDIILK